LDVCFGLLITALLCKFRIDINQLMTGACDVTSGSASLSHSKYA
jgi:hypothetical protein